MDEIPTPKAWYSYIQIGIIVIELFAIMFYLFPQPLQIARPIVLVIEKNHINLLMLFVAISGLKYYSRKLWKEKMDSFGKENEIDE